MDSQKFYYERRVYESVDEKGLSETMSRKTTKKESRHKWANKPTRNIFIR